MPHHISPEKRERQDSKNPTSPFRSKTFRVMPRAGLSLNLCSPHVFCWEKKRWHCITLRSLDRRISVAESFAISLCRESDCCRSPEARRTFRPPAFPLPEVFPGKGNHLTCRLRQTGKKSVQTGPRGCWAGTSPSNPAVSIAALPRLRRQPAPGIGAAVFFFSGKTVVQIPGPHACGGPHAFGPRTLIGRGGAVSCADKPPTCPPPPARHCWCPGGPAAPRQEGRPPLAPGRPRRPPSATSDVRCGARQRDWPAPPPVHLGTADGYSVLRLGPGRCALCFVVAWTWGLLPGLSTVVYLLLSSKGFLFSAFNQLHVI